MRTRAQVLRWIVTVGMILAGWRASPRGGLPSNNPTLNAGVTCTAYLGLGDVQPGATIYVGMRAYTLALALAHTKLFQLRRASDNATQDVLSLCNGLPDDTGAGAGAFCASTTCFIGEFYDQTGNGWNVLQTVNADQMGYSFSCGSANGAPCATQNTSNGQYTSVFTSLIFGQPNTFWTVEDGFNSFNVSGNMVVCSNGSLNEQLYSKNYGGINNTYTEQTTGGSGFSGGVASVGVFQDKLAMFAGASSVLYVNGVSTSGSQPADTCTGTSAFGITGGSADFLEAAAYASDVSGSLTAMRANARTIWNY